LSKNNYLDSDVNPLQLVSKMKNFTGAEIEGLIRSASSRAIARVISNNSQHQHKPHIQMADFIKAFDDIKPMFGGCSQQIIDMTRTNFVVWSPQIKHNISQINEHITNVSPGHSSSIVIDGPSYIGKTFMVGHLIKKLDPDYARIIDPSTLVGKNDTSIQQIFSNALNSKYSIIFIDNFERLIEWCPLGNNFNNQVMQTLMTLMRQTITTSCKLIVIVTCYNYQLLKTLGIDHLFTLHLTMPHMIQPNEAKLFKVEISQEVDIATILRQIPKSS
jgi:vesicle-fusing ATPase